MDSKCVYYVRIAGEVRGPLGLEHLREMASVEVITPENEIAPNAAGPWVRLATLPICAVVFPARRAIGFKATEFEEVNRGSTAAMDPGEALAQANRPPAAFRGREVVVTPQVLRGTCDGEPLSEVQEMVLEVGRRVAANAPPVVLPPVPGPFPRWPWFAALSVIGSAGIMCIPLLYDRRYDVTSMSILLAWVVMLNGLLLAAMMLDRRISRHMHMEKSKMDRLR